jgi:multimeric flavodoxin WrbA
MRIFAVSGSPRKEKGITERIFRPFVEGAKEAGAEVDLVYLQGKKIKPCLGCFHCWWKTPGLCVQKDDQAGLLKLFAECDVAVFATPLYVCGMSAQLKLFFDRFIPITQPFIELRDGHCTHPPRGKYMKGMVVISSCGFHELDNFDAMLSQFHAVCKLGGVKFLGALLRPHGEFLTMAELVMKPRCEEIYAAAREAGRIMVKEGSIPERLQQAVSRELIPLEPYVQGANQFFHNQIDRYKNGSQ